jgi:hypothetical protein
MNTIRVDRLNLKCRGIEAATARAALRELGPALIQQLGSSPNATASSSPIGHESPPIRVRAGVAPAALAGAMAERVTAVIRGSQDEGRKT